MGIFNRSKPQNDATDSAGPVDPALAALTGDYTIDSAHSSIGFTVRHAMVTNVRGSFGEHEGVLSLNGADPAASAASIDVNIGSVNTGIADRDNHLLGEDFFHAEQFPKMVFRSTAAEQLGGEKYRIVGDLTIKDITRPLAIDLEYNGTVTDPYGNQRVGFEGGAELLRSEWGLTWNAALEAGGVMISDKVKLNFDISAIKTG
jgi:polyisoprenoid-binding protein YceI